MGLLPNLEIELQPLLLQQRAPINEKQCSDDDYAEDHRHYSFWRTEVVKEITRVRGEMITHRDHQSIAEKFADEEWGHRLHRMNLCHSSSRE